MLETTIQEISSSKIYPPVLRIKYKELEMTDILPEENVFLSRKVEYNMTTARLWTGIRVTIGFISALAILVWAFRIYTWRSRNKSIFSAREVVPGHISIIIHVLMIGFHSIVMTFLPFFFCLCTLW